MHALPVHLHHQVLRDAKIALSVLCCGRRSKAKVDRVYKGRKASIDDQELRRLVAEGLTPTQIAARLKIARQSVYRVLKGAVA
jgi:DNA invertase Pin-like site-specific DNA recombinase